MTPFRDRTEGRLLSLFLLFAVATGLGIRPDFAGRASWPAQKDGSLTEGESENGRVRLPGWWEGPEGGDKTPVPGVRADFSGPLPGVWPFFQGLHGMARRKLERALAYEARLGQFDVRPPLWLIWGSFSGYLS